MHTDFPDLDLYASGKVRDLYRVGNDHLLLVATDRISAFDYVLATGIPRKGRVLTQLSLFWFDFLKSIVPNHLTTADVRQYPQELQKHAAQLRGRSMLVAVSYTHLAAMSAEDIAVRDAPLRDGVLQGTSDVLLPDHLGELLWPIFARQNLITHGRRTRLYLSLIHI